MNGTKSASASSDAEIKTRGSKKSGSGSDDSGKTSSGTDTETDDEIPDSEEIEYFYESNRIDYARAFLGKKGGYTMRDLKKFFR